MQGKVWSRKNISDDAMEHQEANPRVADIKRANVNNTIYYQLPDREGAESGYCHSRPPLIRESKSLWTCQHCCYISTSLAPRLQHYDRFLSTASIPFFRWPFIPCEPSFHSSSLNPRPLASTYIVHALTTPVSTVKCLWNPRLQSILDPSLTKGRIHLYISSMPTLPRKSSPTAVTKRPQFSSSTMVDSRSTGSAKAPPPSKSNSASTTASSQNGSKSKSKKSDEPVDKAKLVQQTISQIESKQAGDREQDLEIGEIPTC
jgi:hypothetical protein